MSSAEGEFPEMTVVTTLAEESRRQGGFYVPRFEIKIEGVGLPRDVLSDVTQLTYKDSIKEIDGFELTVNNWDAAANSFKYVGGETKESLQEGTPESLRYRLFEPCNKEVTVSMGYVDDMRVMLTGTFTTMEPNFPATGAFGPWLVTPDEADPKRALRLSLRLNGETMQDTTTDLMMFPIPELIAFVSTWTTLEVGDVIVTGTPGGVGMRRDPQVWMKDGDVVEVELEGVGVLRNPIVKEGGAA